MLMTADESLGSFVRRLQEEAFFTKVGPSFALLKPGDWQGLLNWAESFGYPFTLQSLYALCRDNSQILAQMADSQHLSNWSIESLERTANVA